MRRLLSPNWVTIDVPPVMVSVVSRTCSTVHCEDGTWNSAPPRNSIPRLSPRNSKDPRVIARMIPEIVYQTLIFPTKSNDTWPA